MNKIALLIAKNQTTKSVVITDTNLELEDFVVNYVKQSNYYSFTILSNDTKVLRGLISTDENEPNPENTLGLIAFID